MPLDPSDQIAQALTDPASMSGDGVSVSSRSIQDQILGLQMAAQILASAKRRRGILRDQLIPAGPYPDAGTDQLSYPNRWW